MKGELLYQNESWFVQYPECKIPDVGRYCERIKKIPIHPENLELIQKYSMVFDNIEARILSNPLVEFELVKIQDQEYARVKNI